MASLHSPRKAGSYVLEELKNLDLSMLDVLRKVDRTFEIRDDQRFTAVNAKGFEVNILRREAADVDPNRSN